MNEFIETICILEGVPQHLEWHQLRIESTFHFCMSRATPFNLDSALTSYDLPREGKIKCSIYYSTAIIDVVFAVYPTKNIQHLKLFEIPEGYDYRFKFADRRMIDDLFSIRGNADDILMTRGGWITDTSIANIAFRKNKRWYTPSNPLLAGTTWKRLVAEGILIPRPIHQSEIPQFDGFKIFNAMNDWKEVEEVSCSEIR
jgi:4-amino-4-deoxychorismate lyase